jgi:hypothetical protein
VPNKGYWRSVYVRVNRAFSDPIFHLNNFWELPSKFVLEIAEELIEQEKSTANQNSFTAAHMVESLRLVAKSFGGDKKPDYNPQIFLPYPPKDEQEKGKEFEIDTETRTLLLAELEAGRVPRWVMANLSPQIAEWKKNNVANITGIGQDAIS